MDKSGKASVKRATPLVKVLAVFAVLAMMVVGVFAVDGSSVAYAQGDGTGGGASPGSGGISVGSWTRSCDWFDKGHFETDANGDYVYDDFGRKVFVPDQGWGDDSIQWFYDHIIAVEMGTHFVDEGSAGCPEGTEVHMWEACRAANANAVENGRHRYALNYAHENGVSYDEAYAVASRAIKKARIVAVGWMWGPAGYGVYTPNVGPGTDGIYNHDMIWRAGYYPSEIKTHTGDVDKQKETWMKCYDIHGHMRRGDITFDEEGNWSALCDICHEEQDTWQHHVWCEWRRSEGMWYKGGAQFVAIAVCEGEPSGESTGDIMLTKTSRNPKVSGDNLTQTTSNWKTTVGYTPENIVYVVTNSKGKEVGRFILDEHGVGWAAELKNGKTVKKKTGSNYVPYVRVNLSKPSGETFYVQEQTLLADGTTRIEKQGFKCTPTKYEVVVTDKDNYSTTPSKNKAKHVWGENEVLVTGEAIRKDTVSNEVILPTLKVTKLAGKDPTGKDVTTGNNCYDLKDAVFEICKSSDFRSSQVYTMVTKSNGKAYDQKTGKDFVELEEGLGTYYVREARAPYKGYKPDASRPPYEQGARYTKTVTFSTFYPESEANKSVEFTDDPLVDPIPLKLVKVDPKTGMAMVGAEGAATLSGAVYEISYYKGVGAKKASELAGRTPDARAQWKTDSNGYIFMALDPTVNGTTWYYDDGGDYYAPLGTLTVREVTAPEGYLLDTNTYVMNLTDNDFLHTVQGLVETYYSLSGAEYGNPRAWTNFRDDSDNDISNVNYPDDMVLVQENDAVRGGIELRKCDNDALDTLRAKFVYQGGDIDYQGDASLAGAKFTVKLAPGMKPIWVDTAEDGTPIPQMRKVEAGGIVTTLTTDANGYAKTGNRELPYASYLIEELEPSTGYLLPTGWKRTVVISQNNILHSTTTAGDSLLATGAADEPVQRGGLDLLKVDKDTKYPDPQGDATLQGAEFKIYNVSSHDVYVNDTWYPTYKSTKNNSTKVLDEGSDDQARDYRYIGKYNINLNTATPVATIYTGTDFHATLPVTTLPYGTYVIFETQAPTGYLFDQDFKNGVSFTIDYNGEIELFRSPVFIDKAYWDEYWDHKSRP